MGFAGRRGAARVARLTRKERFMLLSSLSTSFQLVTTSSYGRSSCDLLCCLYRSRKASSCLSVSFSEASLAP